MTEADPQVGGESPPVPQDVGDLSGNGVAPAPMGAEQNGVQPQPQPAKTTKIASPTVVYLISTLVELYNADVTSHRRFLLKLKAKIGNADNIQKLNDAYKLFKTMAKVVLGPDMVRDIQENKVIAEREIGNVIKEFRNSAQPDQAPQKAPIIKADTEMIKNMVKLSYIAMCGNAENTKLEKISYGKNREYNVNVNNAMSILDEIEKNLKPSIDMQNIGNGGE